MSPIHPSIANSLLASLSRGEYLRLLPQMERVELVEGQILCESGMPLQHVYFPLDSLLSLLTLVDGVEVFAVALVGREGMTGLGLALGSQISPFRVLVLGTGSAMRMKSKVFVAEFRESTALRRVVLAYVQALTMQISQAAACNRFHGIEARLARWLLMTRDRLACDHFHLTHEMLGQLLGVRRVGVTNAAHDLKLRGLIDYSRGAIDITDGNRLQSVSCSCYRMLGIHQGAAEPEPPPTEGSGSNAVVL
jgi:CRP-like cAMP-binding protein